MFEELLSPLLVTQWGRRTGIAIMLGMFLLILVTFVQGILSWKSDIQLAQSNGIKNDAREAAAKQLTQWIAAIPDWHLYGKYGVTTAAEILPVTSLHIKLVGVVKATPDSDSSVIISEENGTGKVYRVGDVLPASGVKVHAISEDGVILENAGRLEKLPLQRAQLEFQGMPKPMGE